MLEDFQIFATGVEQLDRAILQQRAEFIGAWNSDRIDKISLVTSSKLNQRRDGKERVLSEKLGIQRNYSSIGNLLAGCIKRIGGIKPLKRGGKRGQNILPS